MKPLRLVLYLLILTLASLPLSAAPSHAAPFPDESLPAFGGGNSEKEAPLSGDNKPGEPRRTIEDIGPAGLLELARSLAAQGETSEAVNTYRLLLDRFPQSREKNTAYYELGLLLYRGGRVVEARSNLERLASSWWVEGGVREKARTLLREIDSMLKRGTENTTNPAIGLIMPLKGRYAPYGEAALKGVLLAAGVFGPAGTRKVDVIVRDERGAETGGPGAVRELAANKRVAGIVGPLLNSTSYRSAARAQALGIPLITLAQKEDITGAGEYVFRNSLTPAEQARVVADYAVNVLGKKTFAVLYPETRSGALMAESFSRTVIDLGGEVTARKSYQRGEKDFGSILVDIFKVETDEVREGRRILKEYFPSADIEALYIPDTYKTIGLIMPYIKYYNIEDLQLLGSSSWDSTHLVELAGRGVEGAVFVDGFFANTSRPSSSAFALHYKETYGRTPGELEAEAFDAANLIIRAMDPENPSRSDLRERLLAMSGYEGAQGEVHFDRYRGSVKKPFILTVKDGRIVEAEWPEPGAEDNGGERITPEMENMDFQ